MTELADDRKTGEAAELAIDLPRPRQEALVADPRFVRLRQRILDTLGVPTDGPA